MPISGNAKTGWRSGMHAAIHPHSDKDGSADAQLIKHDAALDRWGPDSCEL